MSHHVATFVILATAYYSMSSGMATDAELPELVIHLPVGYTVNNLQAVNTRLATVSGNLSVELGNVINRLAAFSPSKKKRSLLILPIYELIKLLIKDDIQANAAADAPLSPTARSDIAEAAAGERSEDGEKTGWLNPERVRKTKLTT